jgi:hypothetical protein
VRPKLITLLLMAVVTSACHDQRPPATSQAGGSQPFRPTSGNPPGTGTAPGQTKALAPGQGTFIRTTAVPTTYELEQGPSSDDAQVTQKIRQAIQGSSTLSEQAKKVTVITHGGHAVLLGKVPTDQEREEIEAIARQHCSDVGSHLEIQSP